MASEAEGPLEETAMSNLVCESNLDQMSATALEELRARVHRRSCGWVRGLRLLVRGRALVLQGQAPSYYAKQLAQHAIMEVRPRPIIANEIVVR
jgi:hypothetical protein